MGLTFKLRVGLGAGVTGCRSALAAQGIASEGVDRDEQDVAVRCLWEVGRLSSAGGCQADEHRADRRDIQELELGPKKHCEILVQSSCIDL